MSLAQPQPSAWPMYRAVVGVGLACGTLIVTVFQLTAPVIALNRAEALQRAIFDVLPEAKSSATFRLVDGAFEPAANAERDDALAYAGYDEEQQLVGVALEADGMGYQDVVRLLFGYSFADDAIVGIRVLESRETPGLGDKIETDPGFLANFERLDVTLSEDGAELAHPIEAVKRGEKQHAWQIDGITGATISSEAVARALSLSASRWVPSLQAGIDDFRARE